MVASSLLAAKKLVKHCEFERDATRANNGVLVGKGDTRVITREEGHNITACLFNNFAIRGTSHMATRKKSAFLPLHNVSCGGTVYKTGNEVSEMIVHCYHLCVENHYISIAIGDRYKTSEDGDGSILMHSFSDRFIVQPFETNFCLLLRDISRKVMLYPYHPGLFAVIDYIRPAMPLPLILVPVFPRIGDMVLVKGDDDELWRAEVRTVDHELISARGYFFVKHRNWNENHQWVRESSERTMDTILYKSIVGLVQGQWHGSCWKDS